MLGFIVCPAHDSFLMCLNLILHVMLWNWRLPKLLWGNCGKHSEKDKDVVYFPHGGICFGLSLKYQCKTSTTIKHNKLQSPLYATVPSWIYIRHNHIHPPHITSQCVLCRLQLGVNNQHVTHLHKSAHGTRPAVRGMFPQFIYRLKKNRNIQKPRFSHRVVSALTLIAPHADSSRFVLRRSHTSESHFKWPLKVLFSFSFSLCVESL